MMGPDPGATVTAAPRWIPRPAPTPGRLLTDELVRRAALPIDIARGGGPLLARPRQALAATRDAFESMAEALWAGFAPSSPTPINCEIGPHRRFDWLRLDLETLKQIKRRHGATLNDVVLAIVAGAVRRFLRRRGASVDDLTFRAMVPVSVRDAGERGQLGNRISFLMAPLPVSERDPGRRLAKVVATMQALKQSKQRRGGELLEEMSDRLSTGFFAQFARLGALTQPYNMVVTNVPGPQFPVYLLGAPLREVYPLVPLFRNQALGIALFSYNGGLFWGFNADWDAMPDLHDLADLVAAECRALNTAGATLLAGRREQRAAMQRRRAKSAKAPAVRRIARR